MSPVSLPIPTKWVRLGYLVVFFAAVLSSLPVHIRYDGANAQSSGRRRTQGAPSRNLPNLGETRGIEPGTPKIMPPVPATKCRGRDEKCKKAREKISDNLSENQDRLLADSSHRSGQGYVDWFGAEISTLSGLADLIYWPARIISNFPNISYRNDWGALAGTVVKGANPLGETYGAAASVEPGKKYSPGGWTGAMQSGNAAAFVSQSVPATMTAGEAYTVTVRMLNQGTTTWTTGQSYRLGSRNPTDNMTWGLGRVNLLAGDSVSPGATTTFSFVVTAPSSPGSYNFQWGMVQDLVEWFGAMTPNIAVQVVPRNDSAEFISQTAPSVMGAGLAYSVSITFRNTGNTTWTAANQYCLGSWNPVNNGTWGLGRVYLEAGESVPPGVLKTFSFQVVAPSTTGSYNFQWHMLRELVTWFGAASTNLVIAANAAAVDQAQFVSQSVPSFMTPQNAYSVSVTMKNTGNTTWDSNYRLGSQNPVDNFTWGFGRVFLEAGETIPPGGSKTFTFTVTAPASPSSYALFQWQMVHELVQWFGDYSSGVVVALSPNLNMALIDPINRIGLPGEDLLSRNYNWSLPLLALPGRAGLDLGLALSLNSLVYTKAGSVMHFDPLQGSPAPGFSLGFPEIRNAFINTDAGAQSYLLTMPSGSRVEFRQISTNVYETVDSSHMLLTHDPVNSVFVLYATDGTQCKFVDVTGSGDYKCVQNKDRQGNYITIGYGSMAEIRTVTDTLGRVINFNYDGFNHLLSITQNWGGQTHTWATFAYGTQTIQTNFPGLTLNGTANGAQESVLSRVGLADGSVYSFEYNTYCQVKTIRRYAPNNSNPASFPGDYLQRAYTTYGLPDNSSSAQIDCPRITSRTDWAYDWNNFNAVTSTYLPDSSFASGQVTFPDGTRYKEFFATTGWQRGLTSQTENWSGDVRKKWTTLQWTQDNTGISYQLNPRVTETNVYDEVGNRRRTTMSYTSFGLVSDVSEYDADATTVLRLTHTDYNLSAVYTDRRIIGLPSAQFLYDGANNLFSKVDYQYDLGGGYQVHQGPPVQHDTANYGSGFVQGRGNLNKMRRWDVTDPNNASLVAEYETGYNTSGSVIFTRDPLDHQTSVSFADSFSDGQNRNTFAYPTTMTDPDTFQSFVQYNYDFGSVTRTQNPKGAAVTRTYDAAGRIERITNVVNGAYTRYAYIPNQQFVLSYTTVNDFSEFQHITGFDGHDRVRVTVSDHPTSVGQYKAQFNIYDVMGRLVVQTNPTEIDSFWQPTGDDAAAGWVGTSQAYDWQGRPTVSTNQDGTTKEIIYGGCGCAGGQVVVTRDEVGRRQKMTYDILGRLKTTQALFIQPKDQPLNGDGDVYSTQVNTYNVRDQITQVSQIAQSGGASQITTMQYDGYGRLWKRRAPIESGDTIYEYYADDTTFRVTDARQAAATFTYYGRHFIQDITYTVPAGVAATPNVHYAYDENGNRTLMNDGLGTVTYSYDQLSRMQSETRSFGPQPGPNNPALPGTYALTYQYNLAGQVRVLGYVPSAYPNDNSNWEYIYNTAGEMTAITGSPFVGVSTYATDMKYRAFGALKSLNYGNNFTLMATYNSRQQLQGLKQYRPGGLTVMDKSYQYYPDGKIKFSDDIRYQEEWKNRFDRAFTYDHVGRLTNAWTGSRARNFIDNLPINEAEVAPYNLTYQYDVWGNQTSQSGAIWSSIINETVTYQNMRHDGWTYDAAGNVTNDGSIPFTYDAAGRNVSVDSGTTEATQTLDGDGVVGRRDPNMLSNPNDNDSYPIFYMRSTVLGGKVIVEIDGRATTYGPSQRGRKLDSHVYSAGTRIAIQRMTRPGMSAIVFWKFIDPVTGTEASPSNDGSYIGHQVEPDPLGINVGINDPALFPPQAPTPEQPDYFGGGGVLNPSDPRFSIDGILVDQAFGQMMLGSRSGAAVVAPAEEYISIIRHGQRRRARWQAYTDGHQGYVPVGENHIGGGTLSGSWSPGDTDLARINGATGDEAELGLSLNFSSTQYKSVVIDTEVFVVSNIDKLKKEVSAGNVSYLDDNNIAQCARLPLAWQNDQEGFIESRLNRSRRLTENWQMGAMLKYGMDIKPGTVVATFSLNDGRYPRANSSEHRENHTAIFVEWQVQDGVQGMKVIQQMSGLNGKAEFGFIPFDKSKRYFQNAYRFRCVEIPTGK